jgi:hypothetical protein
MIFIEGNYDTDGTIYNASGAAKVKFRFWWMVSFLLEW